MSAYLTFYLAVREILEATYEKGINPKRLTIGAEQFRILHEEDSSVYHEDRPSMVFMGMDIQLSDEPSLIRIDGAEARPKTPIIVPVEVVDVQIGLFD